MGRGEACHELNVTNGNPRGTQEERPTTSSIHTSCSQDLKSHVRHGYEVPQEPEGAGT